MNHLDNQFKLELAVILSCISALLIVMFGISFIPQPYKEFILNWSLLGFIFYGYSCLLNGLSNVINKLPFILFFGPHIVITQILFLLTIKVFKIKR